MTQTARQNGETLPVVMAKRLETEADTIALGRALADCLRPGDVLALEGPLGSGKSVLARGMIHSLCGSDTIVPSPTFTLVQIYETPRFSIWHCDLFRLEGPEETVELGLEEAFAEAVTLIEWPDRLESWIPDRRLAGRFACEEPAAARVVELCGGDDWRRRLQSLEGGDGA